MSWRELVEKAEKNYSLTAWLVSVISMVAILAISALLAILSQSSLSLGEC